MSVYQILIATGDDDPALDTDAITSDLDKAFNDHGLLGGNFLVSKEGDDEADFWAEWWGRSQPPGERSA